MRKPYTAGSDAVAVLTASFGDGHNAAARGVAAALDGMSCPNTGAVDLLKKLKPETMRWLDLGYRTLITRWPMAWRSLYSIADRMPLGGSTPDPLPRLTRGVARYLNAVRPAAIISTYPIYAHLIERLFGAGPLPFGLLTVVTDSTSVNRSWVSDARGHYAVADGASAAGLEAVGVDKGRVHITGFPVHPAFGDGRPAIAEDSPPSPFRVVYAPSTKTPEVIATLAALRRFAAEAPGEFQLTVVLGRHERRLAGVAEQHAPEGATVLGWTDQIPDLLKSGHLYISKAGGASVQESLASGCPMLINKVVPGQEEGNAVMLCGAGAGAMMPAPEGLADYLLEFIGAEGGKAWCEMRRKSLEHGRPGAARAVAELALDLTRP